MDDGIVLETAVMVVSYDCVGLTNDERQCVRQRYVAANEERFSSVRYQSILRV